MDFGLSVLILIAFAAWMLWVSDILRFKIDVEDD